MGGCLCTVYVIDEVRDVMGLRVIIVLVLVLVLAVVLRYGEFNNYERTVRSEE